MTIDVRADAFLRGQVRRMVAGLLEVGLGTWTSKDSGRRFAGRPALNGARLPRRASASGASSSVGDERTTKEDER